MKNKGFSLVELIVVIAIMAILVGVAVPVYTSYIGKAQKNKDIQMVDEIKHAVEIAAIGDKWYDKFTPGVVGTIVITDEGATVDGTKITVNGVEVEPLEDALIATFGDLSDLKVSYDEWTGTLTSGSGDVVGTATVIANSAYASDVSGLLNSVQNVTVLYEGYLDKLGELAKPTDYLDTLFGTTDYTDTQAANGMIVYVAEKTKTEDLDETAFVNYWRDSAFSSGTFYTNSVAGMKLDRYAAKGAEYAYVQSIVTHLNCPELNTAYSAYQGITPITMLSEHIKTTCASCKTAYRGINVSLIENDARAYLNFLDQIADSKDYVVQHSASENMYTDSPITQYVQSYVSVAELMKNANVEDGQIVIIVSIDSKGGITTNAYPIEY